MQKRTIVLISVTFLALFISGCSIYKSVVNVTRLRYKLGGVANVSVNGISLQNKSRLQDFSAFEIAQLTSLVVKGTLPLELTINIDAENPNTGGFNRTDASILSFPFRFMIDGKNVFEGNISSPVSIPGTGEKATIPLSIRFDAIKSIKNGNFESMLNMVLNIAGHGNSPSKLEVYSRPTISTVLGNFTYPSEIKIVQKEFTTQ